MIMRRSTFLSYMVLGALPVSSYTASDPGVQDGCYWTIPNVGTYNTHFNTDWDINPSRASSEIASSIFTVAAGHSQGGQEVLGPVSPAQLVTSHNDTLFGSVRTDAMFSNLPGVTHGFSMYSNDDQKFDFAFLTRGLASTHPTNEQVASDSPTTSYAAVVPEDAIIAWHEYRVDWMADRISFYIDGECVSNITENVPQQAGYWLWESRSNEHSWTDSPPHESAVPRIRSIDAYYNRVSVAAVALLNRSWCGIGASTTSTSTSTSSVPSSTEATSFPPSSTTAIATPVTFVGSIKGSSTSGSTTTTAVPSASFVPVTPPPTGFYLQSNSSGSSDISYASVASGIAGQVSFVPSISSASRFTIDASGNLVEQSPTQGYAASLNFNINNQRVNFDSLGQSSRYGYLTCSVQNHVLSCTAKGNSYSAVTCGGDGYLYFAQTVPRSCELVNLVPVSS